jgi:transposase
MRVWRMRTGISFTVSPTDRQRLMTVVKDRNAPQKRVWRAEIILLSADGAGTVEIMRQTGKSKTCVWRWQERFAATGFEGLLRDKTRPSRIPPLGTEAVRRVVALTLQDPLGERTHWTADMMAQAAGISASAVRRIWKAHGLQPHRWRQFKLSNDPQFVDKLRDVVALYVDPPAHAIVLSVDEKSQIQALDRTQPGLPMKKGRLGTMTHDYKRNGTTTLFAALNVLDGTVIGKNMQRHRHQEFIRFLNAIDAEAPAGTAVHVVLDNYAAHKHPKCVPGSTAICVSPSTSRLPRARGSTRSRASSQHCRSVASSAVPFIRSWTSRPPSTATSQNTTSNANRSSGPPTPTKSSPPSSVGTKC